MSDERSYAEVLERAATCLGYFAVDALATPEERARDAEDAAQLRTLASQPLTTQLDTARAERDIAVQEREQVTRELEEAKRLNVEIAMSKSVALVTPQMEPHEAVTHLQKMLEQQRRDYVRLEQAHREVYATARRDALHEAKAKVETLCIDRDRQCFDCGDSDRDYLAQQILALLGAEP